MVFPGPLITTLQITKRMFNLTVLRTGASALLEAEIHKFFTTSELYSIVKFKFNQSLFLILEILVQKMFPGNEVNHIVQNIRLSRCLFISSI